MRPRAAGASAGAAVLTCVLVLLSSSPHETAASWTEQADVVISDARTDSFGMTTVNSTNTVDHRQAAPTDIANEPAIRVTNTSTTHSSWIDVVSTKVTVPASNTTNTLLPEVDLDYAVGSSCDPSPATSYWNVAGGATLMSGSTYSRSSTKIDGAGLGPGSGRAVCPVVRRSGISDRDFLLRHAGRQLDIAATLRQRSEAAATWASAPTTLSTRYQVKLPPPTRPSSDAIVCHRTSGFGNRDGLTGPYGKLYWAWPFAGQSGDVSTPAVDRFVLLRSLDGSNWSEFKRSRTQDPTAPSYSVGGSARSSTNINSDDLRNNSDEPVWLSVRAYLYPGSNVYVDADWKVQAHEGGAFSDSFRCGNNADSSSGVANSSNGPYGLS